MRPLILISLFALSTPVVAGGRHVISIRLAPVAVAPVETPNARSAPRNEAPEPGACTYVQPGVKTCSALPDGQGAFDVFTFTPAFLYVRTEDPIVNVVPPDPQFFQTDRRDNTVVIVPTRTHLPGRTTAVISTKNLTFTLNVRPGSRDRADTQLMVLDPERNHRQAERAELSAELEPRLVEKLHSAELEDLAREGAELRAMRGKTVARNAELIVLRAEDVLRVGAHRYLFFSIQNRSAEPFQPRSARLWLGPREEHPAVRFARPSVGPAAELRGVLELPPSATRGVPLKLRVDDIDPRRSVELPRLEAP